MFSSQCFKQPGGGGEWSSGVGASEGSEGIRSQPPVSTAGGGTMQIRVQTIWGNRAHPTIGFVRNVGN